MSQDKGKLGKKEVGAEVAGGKHSKENIPHKPDEIGKLKKEVSKTKSKDEREGLKNDVGEDGNKNRTDESSEVEPINPFESAKESGRKVIDVPAEEHKVIESSPVTPPVSSVEEVKEDVWDVLGQAGITKKRIVYFFH